VSLLKRFSQHLNHKYVLKKLLLAPLDRATPASTLKNHAATIINTTLNIFSGFPEHF